VHFHADVEVGFSAIDRGLKFDSSGMYVSVAPILHAHLISRIRTRRRDSKALFPKNEQDVFNLLGLDWVPPPLRNADT
jgi:DNA polymerase mu